MNKFNEIKTILKADIVIQHYLGLPEKHSYAGNWYKSPFRKEKTASFCVSDKGIHDFGDSTHYDIISFVQKYFNTTPYKALGILCNDFNIYQLGNEYEDKKIIEMLKKKEKQERQIKEKIEKWYNREIQRISDEIIANRKCLNIFKDKHNFILMQLLYNEQVKLEYYWEILFNADERTKEKLYLTNN